MKRLLLIFALIFSLVAPLAAHPARFSAIARAQTQGATVTRAAVAKPVSDIADRKLANGLEIVVLEDHSVPIVTIELAVRNGSFTEPPELNGLSHLYEHMFFKANRAIANQEEYLQRIGQLGIAYNGETREEVVEYYFTTTSPNIRAAMNFMRDATRYPLFDEKEFQREQQVVIGEIDRNESEPVYYLNREMSDRLFYKYPSRKNPLGDRKTVATSTTTMMRLIQGRYYVPNNSALVITGDVQTEDIYKMAQELFGDWARRDKEPFGEFPLVEHPPLAKSEGNIIKQPVTNVLVEIGWQGPSIGKDDAATYAADTFSFILQQPDSKFQRDLVDSGLVNAVATGYYTQRNVGPISVVAQITPDKAKAALKAIYNEIGHFNDKDYFTDEQLDSAKALLEADDLYSREKFDDYAKTLGFWWSSTGIDYFRGYLANLRRTSRSDISRYVSTYIQGKPHVGLALISEAAQQQAKLTPEDLIGQ
ncbi:MAG: insulinase family protein [Acidobacteria bacterium]|nr:MAG: insulinase family protein [Acidobacteriota bacterium]